MNMIIGKTKKIIEQKEKELYQYLSNNYKDEALKTFKEYEQLLEELHSDGKINDKDYGKFQPKLEEYRKMFKRYHH